MKLWEVRLTKPRSNEFVATDIVSARFASHAMEEAEKRNPPLRAVVARLAKAA